MPTVTLEVLSPAVDPRLSEGSPARVRVRVDDAGRAPGELHPLTVTVRRGGTALAALLTREDLSPGSALELAWDGTAQARPLEPGPITVEARYGCALAGVHATREASLVVLRVGVLQAQVNAGDGVRLPLLWHRAGGLARNYWVAAVTRPVLSRGANTSALQRALPLVWSDLSTPPMDGAGAVATSGYNLPFALQAGGRPELALTFGRVEGAAVPLRARVDGLSAAADVMVTDGGAGAFRWAASPAPQVGRYELAVKVRYDARGADGAWRELGAETLALRAYGLLGPQTVARTTRAPYAAWVAVADAVTGWVGGATRDPLEVASRVVRGVHRELGLGYDTVQGASAYTDYTGEGFDGGRFDLSAFLARDNGATVNCSDCASIVSTYANLVGCDLGYNILTQDFPLHAIRAIGGTRFTSDPFRRGRPGGFSYHAVTSPSGLGRVFDATLAVDGDSDPSRSPYLDTLVDGLDQAFYLRHLSPARVEVSHDDKTLIE